MMYSTSLYKKFLALFLILFISHTIFSQEYFSDPDDLADAVNAAGENGGTFIVNNGTYNDFEATFEKIATATNPIIIQAESIGGVTLTGESHFVFKKSAFITFEGFIFDGQGDDTLIKLEGCNNIRISRNVFELETSDPIKWLYIGGYWNDYNFLYLSHDNRIDHNIFKNKTTPGNFITIDGTSNEDETVLLQSQNDRIDHNYFYKNQPRVSNEKESIRIGWSEMSTSSGYTVVEFNLFEDCDGDPEIISVKSCDNIIRHNTFLKSYGTLSLRHGNRSRVEGNYFLGAAKANGTFESSTLYTGGIRIYGTDHIIINNHFEGLQGTRWDAPITLTQGDAIDGSSTSLSKHFRAERVIIAYNTLVDNAYGIEIGFDNNDNYSKGLSDITIANNLITGSSNSLVSYIEGQDQGDEITWLNNIMYPTGEATLTSDASSFSSNEVEVIDPKLIFDGTVWKSSEESPMIDYALPSLLVNEDIEGQLRPETGNPGADHFSLETIKYAPLTPEDVGPFAYENEEPIENLYLSTIATFPEEGGSQKIAIVSNLDWIITKEDTWITVNPESGFGNDSISISVSENLSLDQRISMLTAQGGEIIRTINIIQNGANAPNGDTEIIPLSVSASDFQDPNTPENTLDKDLNTRWSAESESGLDGAGQSISYDLGKEYKLSLLKIAFHKGNSRLSYFDVLTSTNGIDYTDILTEQVSSGTTESLENYLFSSQARYVRIIGFGNSDSDWTSISEVEIYGSELVSVENGPGSKPLIVYPSPAKGILKVKNISTYNQLRIYAMDGNVVMDKYMDSDSREIALDVSMLTTGNYVMELSNDKNFKKSIIIHILK